MDRLFGSFSFLTLRHRLLVFRWQEHGGPPVTQPKQRGFGSAVLEQVMAEYFETPPTIEFAATGVRYEVSGSLDGLTTEKGIEQAPLSGRKFKKHGKLDPCAGSSHWGTLP